MYWRTTTTTQDQLNSRFELSCTLLPGLTVLQRNVVGDSRGSFERLFCAEELHALIPKGKHIVQINYTRTHKLGTIRGLHFQYPPHAEAKFVSCLHGEVFDVVVDCRQDSATLLRWHAEVLSAENRRSLAIPQGFAHGFQTLTDGCEMLYLHTSLYEPNAEGGLNPHDPILNIAWPLPVVELSPRDADRPFVVKETFGITL